MLGRGRPKVHLDSGTNAVGNDVHRLSSHFPGARLANIRSRVGQRHDGTRRGGCSIAFYPKSVKAVVTHRSVGSLGDSNRCRFCGDVSLVTERTSRVMEKALS